MGITWQVKIQIFTFLPIYKQISEYKKSKILKLIKYCEITTRIHKCIQLSIQIKNVQNQIWYSLNYTKNLNFKVFQSERVLLDYLNVILNF